VKLKLVVISSSCGLYYKHITIVNYDSSVVNRFEASLTDNVILVIYDHHMFIVQVQILYNIFCSFVTAAEAKWTRVFVPVKLSHAGIIFVSKATSQPLERITRGARYLMEENLQVV
jgi:hypothetical protein